MKCDVNHQLISFDGHDCPLCIVLDGLLQCEQIFCELDELLNPGITKWLARKTKKKAPKTKAKSKGKLLQFPRLQTQKQPDGVA